MAFLHPFPPFSLSNGSLDLPGYPSLHIKDRESEHFSPSILRSLLLSLTISSPLQLLFPSNDHTSHKLEILQSTYLFHLPPFSISYIFFMCMSVLLVGMQMHPSMQGLWKPEEGVESHGVAVSDSSQLPCDAGN